MPDHSVLLSYLPSGLQLSKFLLVDPEMPSEICQVTVIGTALVAAVTYWQEAEDDPGADSLANELNHEGKMCLRDRIFPYARKACQHCCV